MSRLFGRDRAMKGFSFDQRGTGQRRVGRRAGAGIAQEQEFDGGLLAVFCGAVGSWSVVSVSSFVSRVTVWTSRESESGMSGGCWYDTAQRFCSGQLLRESHRSLEARRKSSSTCRVRRPHTTGLTCLWVLDRSWFASLLATFFNREFSRSLA